MAAGMVIDKWMIYGASGFTGKLIIEQALARGHQPILAGRNEEAILALAEQYDLAYRVFSCRSVHQLSQQLDDVGVVLNCAGPFAETAELMRNACLKNGVHYLDITGEYKVLADSYACHEQARKQGVVIISGVGFDVVPTDVLAVKLKALLPSASHLQLAFTSRLKPDIADDEKLSPQEKVATTSHGTRKTMLQLLPEQGRHRQHGKLETIALAGLTKTFSFADKPRFCMSIPWGDIVTAFYSTDIPNITVFTQTTVSQARWLKRLSFLSPLLASPFMQKYLRRRVDKTPAGPSAKQRAQSQMCLYGQVSDGEHELALEAYCPEGYDFTASASLFFVEELLAHKIMPGAYTPTQAVDADTLIDMLGIEIISN